VPQKVELFAWPKQGGGVAQGLLLLRFQALFCESRCSEMHPVVLQAQQKSHTDKPAHPCKARAIVSHSPGFSAVGVQCAA
jgi:hypothetical protein